MRNTTVPVAEATEEVREAAIPLAMAARQMLDTIERYAGQATFDSNVSSLRFRVGDRAIELAQILHERSEETLADRVRLGAAAHDVCHVMFGGREPSSEFWETKLGQDVAWAIGYPLPRVPPAAAWRILGVARRGLYHLIDANGLQLTAEGVKAELRRRLQIAAEDIAAYGAVSRIRGYPPLR